MTIEKLLKYKIEILILIIILVFSYYRSPFIFLEGRFIGEECSHHLKYALQNGFISNLFYYDQTAGYYNLIPNLLIGLSVFFPIEIAPFFTIYGSYIILFFIFLYCLFSKSYLFENKLQKTIGCLIFFLTPPNLPHIWMYSLTSQIHLFFLVTIILFLKNENNFFKKISPFFVFLGGFSGVYSCLITPFFLAKYIFKKQVNDLINFIILSLSSLLQLSLIVYSKLNYKLHESVLVNDFNFEMVISFVYNVLVKSITGRHLPYFLYEKIQLLQSDKILVSLTILLVIFIIFFIVLKKNFKIIQKDFVLLSLFLIFILVSILIFVGSVGNQMGGHYAAATGIIYLLLIFRFSQILINKKFKMFFYMIILISIFTGIYEFRPPQGNLKHNYLKFLDCIDCPKWKDEITNWKKDKNYLIRTWPYNQKHCPLDINLDKHFL